MKVLACSVLFALHASSFAPTAAIEPLRTVAKRVAKSLLKTDWCAFRKDAGPNLVIEERWTAYEDYFDKKNMPYKDERGVLGEHEFRAVSFFTTISNKSQLRARHAKVFRAFCKWVQDSRQYTSTSWDWPWVSQDGIDSGLDHYKVVGPCAGGKIASNVDWVVEFAKNSGKWRVRRLILGGH